MGWYRGTYRFPHRSLGKLLALSQQEEKDNYFRVRNKDKADPTVVKFVYSPLVLKDRRCYCPCARLYDAYKEYCTEQGLSPVSSWQFKHNMQAMGFVYQKHKRFYAGYYQNKVTTAYKNIALKRR